MVEQIGQWISAYGYPAIFVLLVFGIVGLPVPDETLMTFTGYLIYKGRLSLVPAYLSAFLGSVCGITISYILGRTFGLALIHRYGKYVHLTEERIQYAHNWFERVGRWGLTFGYFIPGIRHFTAYAAGMSELGAHEFAAFAYAGACIWSATFIALGYFLGERWESTSEEIHKYLLVATAVAVVLGLLYLGWRRWRARKPQV
jgi:membrane protein DedA with SNARE-associated domain